MITISSYHNPNVAMTPWLIPQPPDLLIKYCSEQTRNHQERDQLLHLLLSLLHLEAVCSSVLRYLTLLFLQSCQSYHLLHLVS